MGPNPTAQLKSANFSEDYGFDARPGLPFQANISDDLRRLHRPRGDSSIPTRNCELCGNRVCGALVAGGCDGLHGPVDNCTTTTATIEFAAEYDPCENALVLSSIEVDLSTTMTGSRRLCHPHGHCGHPNFLSLTGINGAADYTIAQPGAIDGIAAGSYSVTATDANSCTSNIAHHAVLPLLRLRRQ